MPVLSTLGAAIANVYGFTSGLIKDQYFNLVSLLLPGNGTNGAQNNTFLDGSSNNFTITRNGNTTQGTFSPFSQTGWGNYFDGSGDYLTTPIANVQLGSGDFCVEQWVYLIARPNTVNCIFSNYTSYSTGVLGLYYGHAGGNTAKYQVGYNGSSFPSLQSTTDIVYNTWVHLAVVRSSGTIKLYINGVAESSTITSATATLNGNGASWWVGTEGQSGSTGVINAYVSNHRVVVGSPVYTGNFTPSTAPLTAISGTSLLTCQSNRFRDSSSNNHAITVNGNPSVVPFSPFAPTQSYSAAAVGGSGYFDGNTDYLSVANQTALQLSGSQFTIDGWFYFTTSGVDNYIVVQSSALADANVNWLVRVTSGNKLRVLVMTSGATAVSFDGSTTVTANSWHHFAATCDGTGAGSNVRSWLDGVYQGGTTVNTANINTNTAATQIGGWSFASSYSTGYVSGLRILKGTALYTGTSDITVPTSPPTAITNTSLLLNFTNAGVVDATAKNVLETVGNAQISTTQSKWGGGSISFASASNSNLLGNTPSNWTFLHDGSTWTVEFWLYPTDISSFQGLIATNGAGSTNIGLNVVINAGAISISFTRGVSGSAATFNSSAVLNANQWNYVGVTFTGSTKTCAFFINGASAGSSSNTGFAYSSSTSTYPPYIGQTGAPGFPYYFNGYIDDLRITRGVARTITANPTAPFPVQ